MSRKRENSSANDEPSAPFWMLTYGDVMTLLLTFFVLLLSFSSIQEAKFKQAMGALQAALGVLEMDQSVLENPMEQQSEARITDAEDVEGQMSEVVELVRDLGLGEDVDVVPTEQGYALRISSPVLFDLGKADLRPEGVELLAGLADYLAGRDYDIRIEGHTDNIPIHTARFPSNWELSTARALSVLKLMNSRGVDARRLSAAGYGEFRPLVANDSEENRQINRRVEIYVKVKSQEDHIELDQLFGR